MTKAECQFCNLAEDRIWVETESAIVLLDNFPVPPDHTIVIPEDHIGTLMELPETDLNKIWGLVAHVRKAPQYYPAVEGGGCPSDQKT